MGNPKIETGNLLEELDEAPTSLLVEAKRFTYLESSKC